MKVLVCGGAGYIGSHMVKWLAARGFDITVLDNLSTGHRAAVRWGELVEADLRDAPALEQLFSTRRFGAVMHFCARSLVGESMTTPYEYYANNVGGTLNLLQAMQRHAWTGWCSPPPRRCSVSRCANASTRATPRRRSTPTAPAS